MTLPIRFEDVLAARERIRPYLQPTPLRSYEALDEEIGAGIRVLVKHENHQPTNAFKIRNALSALTLLPEEKKQRGVVVATRGNYGQGVALAGRLLGVPVTVCVPLGNNPEKNRAIRGFGAELIEQGSDYDETVEVAKTLVRERSLHLIHSTNDPAILAGAATLSLEILEQAPDVEAIVVSIGGGSQAVGTLVAASGLRPEVRPEVEVFGVQAAGAPAQYEGWRAGSPLVLERADTFADGLATRSCYELTFPALREGLSDFVLATEAEIADAVRLVLRTTHNLAEGAGAASFAGLRLLRDRLASRKVAVVLSGSNIDADTLKRVVNGEI